MCVILDTHTPNVSDSSLRVHSSVLYNSLISRTWDSVSLFCSFRYFLLSPTLRCLGLKQARVLHMCLANISFLSFIPFDFIWICNESRCTRINSLLHQVIPYLLLSKAPVKIQHFPRPLSRIRLGASTFSIRSSFSHISSCSSDIPRGLYSLDIDSCGRAGVGYVCLPKDTTIDPDKRQIYCLLYVNLGYINPASFVGWVEIIYGGI